SWMQVVKSSTWPDDADKDDASATINVLQKTNQSFIIYNIDSDDKWKDFLDLARAAVGTNIDIYAAVDPPHILLSATNSRWFALAPTPIDPAKTGIDPAKIDEACADPVCHTPEYSSSDTYYAKQKCIDGYLRAWKTAARHVARQSLNYPNIKG